MRKENKAKYDFATTQRMKCLKNAFKTIDAFANSSLDPIMFKNYDDIKYKLFMIYGENRNKWDIIEKHFVKQNKITKDQK